MKAEAKTKAQAYVQSIMEEAQLNAKMMPKDCVSKPSKELVQNKRWKTLSLFLT